MAAPGAMADNLIVVKVAKDGGVSGGAAANCTWTYTVTDLAGNELGTGLTPEVPRLTNVEYEYADENSDYGLAAWDGTTLVLLVAFGECPKETACP